jgi:outer membrane lipoprotein LolB
MAGLAGCATPGSAPETTAVLPDPTSLRSWTASGRMAFAATGEGGSGSFVWKQSEAQTRLDLRGPFGTGALRILADDESLVVDDSTGRSLDAEAARVELQARLGADLPWTNLRYWMLGVPAPGAPAVVSNAETAPRKVIDQADWTIGYDTFTTESGVVLPRRFTARRGDVRVKIVVDTWTMPSIAPTAADPSR